MQIIYIYALKDPRYDRVRYIGKTNNLDRRYIQHVYNQDAGNIHKRRWVDGLKSEGLKPVIEVIEECTENNWIEREIYWIAKFRKEFDDLINMANGGNGYTSETWRVSCVESAAKRFNVGIKRCFVCGGKTISNMNVCSKCMREIDPDYQQSDWYKFLKDDYHKNSSRDKRNKNKFLRLDAQNNI